MDAERHTAIAEGRGIVQEMRNGLWTPEAIKELTAYRLKEIDLQIELAAMCMSAKEEPELRAAARPTTQPDRLSKLASSRDWVTRYLVGMNAKTMKPDLDLLASDEAWPIHRVVARNPNVGIKTQTVLAVDPWVLVRSAVACRTLSPDLLEQLAHDSNPSVVAAVAKNPWTPKSVLVHLLAEPT